MLFVRMGGPTLMENCLPVAGDGIAESGSGSRNRKREIAPPGSGPGCAGQVLGVDVPAASELLRLSIADTGERQIDHLFRPVDQSIALTLCGNGQFGTGDGWPGDRRGADEVSGR